MIQFTFSFSYQVLRSAVHFILLHISIWTQLDTDISKMQDSLQDILLLQKVSVGGGAEGRLDLKKRLKRQNHIMCKP